MRAEKQILAKEYAARLNASPFFIVVGYQGLKVAHLTELRKRLKTAGAEIHVVKNSIFRVAAKEAGVAELNGSMAGQMAVVTGQKDISAASKALKNFAAEFDKLKLKFGYLNNHRLVEAGTVVLEGMAVVVVLRGKSFGLVVDTAPQLAAFIDSTVSQIAHGIQ